MLLSRDRVTFGLGKVCLCCGQVHRCLPSIQNIPLFHSLWCISAFGVWKFPSTGWWWQSQRRGKSLKSVIIRILQTFTRHQSVSSKIYCHSQILYIVSGEKKPLNADCIFIRLYILFYFSVYMHAYAFSFWVSAHPGRYRKKKQPLFNLHFPTKKRDARC